MQPKWATYVNVHTGMLRITAKSAGTRHWKKNKPEGKRRRKNENFEMQTDND